ncbi:MAG: hypothetical protein ACJAQZ_003609, partial [Planctomycetota bacterium]
MNHDNQDQSAQQRAKELQMRACLTELGGVGPDRSLASRILDELAARDRDGSVIAARVSTPRWLIAAFVLVGLSVVGGIAYMRTQLDGDIDKGAAHGGNEAPVDSQVPDPDVPDPDVPTPNRPTPNRPNPQDGTQDPKPVTTLICDYTSNCILEVDSEGTTINRWTDLLGIWDASLLPNGHLLLVEFSTSRVTERTKAGKII